MIIESIILIAIAAAHIASAIYIVYLVFGEIIDWFRSHRKVNRDQLCFTLQERISSGDYKTVQGVLNKSTNKLDKVRQIESSRIDDELADYHRFDDLVVYS
jgi:hypothetical protein